MGRRGQRHLGRRSEGGRFPADETPERLPDIRFVRAINGEGRATSVRAALIQARTRETKDATVERQLELVADAGAGGAKIVCLQELCNGPYFCQDISPAWFEWAEDIP